MVVRPEEISKFGEAGEALLLRLEEYVDRQLRNHYKGYGYTIYLLSEFDFGELTWEILEELTGRYKNAGWNVSFERGCSGLGEEVCELLFSTSGR